MRPMKLLVQLEDNHSFQLKKCLKVRQELGTRENLKIWNLENLKFKIA